MRFRRILKRKNKPEKIQIFQDEFYEISPIPRHDMRSFDKLVYAEDIQIKPDFVTASFSFYL